MRDQQLLPTPDCSDEYKQDFRFTLKTHIGGIRRLQEDAEIFLKPFLKRNINSPFRKRLSKQERREWDELQRSKIQRQRWSDGLVIFSSLVEEEIRCPMNAIFGIFASCGNFCLLSLGRRQPVRGAIEIAWGVELHPGEVYGPAVVRAYELESSLAQYPRIVIGQTAINYLEVQRDRPEDTKFAQVNKSMAELCLNMCIRDADGQYILHYLGGAFREAVTQALHQELYNAALQFVHDQLQQHRNAVHNKLTSRYERLLSYFEAYPPDARH